MGRRARTSTKEPTKDSMKTVREALLKAVRANLAAAEASASGTKADAEAAHNFAKAAEALMATELARELIVGKDGFKVGD